MKRFRRPISVDLVIIHLFKAEPTTVYNHQNNIVSGIF
jgi:hypothetical protein